MAKPPLAHILIVEDDSDLLEVLKYVLEEAGYATSLASDGAQALELARSEPIDLVILDVSMPGKSGIDVVRDLRADPETADILIAIHSGLAEEEVRQQVSNFDLFMSKGDNADALVQRIYELVELRASNPSSSSESIASPSQAPDLIESKQQRGR